MEVGAGFPCFMGPGSRVILITGTVAARSCEDFSTTLRSARNDRGTPKRKEPVPEDTGSTLKQGMELKPPTGFGHLPKKSLRTASKREKSRCLTPATSIITDSINFVEKRLSRGEHRPSDNSRTTLPRQARRGLTQGAQHAQVERGAARRLNFLANGDHRHMPRAIGGHHRSRHRHNGTSHMDNEEQPPITAL